MIHENIELTGSFIVSGSFVLPSHPSTGSVTALTGSMYHDTTDNVLKVYTGNSWVTVGEQTGSAAGGGGASTDIEYLLVAGGGGAAADSGGGPGGGAGGLLSSSLSSVTSGSSFTITIGGGGIGYDGSNPSVNGTDSTIAGATISTITAVGGGGAGSFVDTGTTYLGHDGGSGGGSGNGNASVSRPNGGSGTVGQGNDGGGALGVAVNDGNNAAGGGGGAGAAGADAASGAGGNGGDGLQSSITGTSTYYAGGGAGGTRGSGTAGTGGQGGGGNANNTTNGTGQDGSANTGGGAGGSRSTPTAAGGSGVAIFAYDSGSINCAGGIVGDAGNGRKYNQFNSSGTFKVGNTSDFQIVTDSLSLHYDVANFNSRGASDWTDLSGNGRNSTVYNGSLSNYYHTFNGSSTYSQYAGEAVTSDNLTIEVWLTIDNPAETGTYREIFSHQANNNRGIYWGKTGTANETRFGGTTYTFSSINASTFTHFVVTRNSSGNVVFYENGSQGGTATGHGFATSQSIYNDTGTRIGRQYGSYTEYWDGKIAQVRVYNKVLTATEVLQNYNATKTNFV